ncbi:hypothetical protein glysoja_026128 [Glycine soja]|uniref:Uncharacterized protein n=1 Tax=Glycine soja TaxID=3848 RepID=A0A0B2RRS4_GLYSO|nr:hypothetical protein glysoja_026128 [Glycine soja]
MMKNLQDAKAPNVSSSCVALTDNVAIAANDRDCILSQHFFCTSDYITPDSRNVFNGFD